MDPTAACASDLMTREVATIGHRASLRVVAKMMRENGVSSLVVEPQDQSDTFGIITLKDVIIALLVGNPSEQVVAVHMSKPAISVNPQLSIENCVLLMQSTAVRRLLVVNGTELVGILSSRDIFNAFADEIQ